ncbi:U-box domain-containing protein 45-like [Hibiscus syriacus]|uniref:U-box domain-containing protein 45-like n=1 Tax=Hibiscus syriacus TaxID=106335 RepID=UPI001924F8E3|nr:U-box domain-containing protein 45-like [Hibiscus syriacus]
MAKYHRNDIGSLVLDRHSTTSAVTHFRLCNAFSGSSLRRKIFNAVSCGASSRHRHQLMQEMLNEAAPQPKPKSPPTTITIRSVLKEYNEPKNTDFKVVKKAVNNVKPEKVTLAMLGTIPPLVAMLDFEDSDLQVAALYALLNIGIGNDMNKATIVKAGAVHKMLKLIEPPNEPSQSVSDGIITNFLGLSALDSNKPIIGSSGAIPFLLRTLKILDKRSGSQARHDALRALYNLSISPSNISFILEADLIPFLMNTLGGMEVSERILAIFSNVVSTPEGGKGISVAPEAFPILVDVLNWTDSPGCPEKASYVLMVMAHKAYGDRQAMIEAGIVSSLLELTLLGSTLAQKRASRILEVLRVDKEKQVSDNFSWNSSAAVAAPIYGYSSSSTNQYRKECFAFEEGMMSEEKKAVKQMVQQSL